MRWRMPALRILTSCWQFPETCLRPRQLRRRGLRPRRRCSWMIRWPKRTPRSHRSPATHDHDWENSPKREYKRALELRPSYSTGHHYYATFLMSMGRHAEALQEMEQAQKLDPLSPIIATFIGRAYYFAGRNQDSIDQYMKILASDPNFLVARTYLILSEEQAGDIGEALLQAQTLQSQIGVGDSRIRELRLAWQADGERGYWKGMLRQRLSHP